MSSTGEKMEQQYGKVSKTRLPQILIKAINKFGIARVDYSLKMMEKYQKSTGENILDIGCGDGEFCVKNIGKFKNIYGLDISSSRIQRCKDNYKNISFTLHDMNKKTYFEDNCFDVVNSLVCFEWIYDLNTALKEVNRIMKDDGIFILEVNNMGFIYRRLKLLLGYYPETSSFSESEWKNIGRDASVCHMFTKNELSRFLNNFGFEVLEVRGTGIFYQIRNWWPSLLCGDLFYVLRKK